MLPSISSPTLSPPDEKTLALNTDTNASDEEMTESHLIASWVIWSQLFHNNSDSRTDVRRDISAALKRF